MEELLTSLTVALVVTLAPFAVIVLLLRFADRRERARAEVVSRQIMLTDAVHRELGAVVAPTVTKRIGGLWQVFVAVPLERPETVAAVVSILRDSFVRNPLGRGRFEIVLTAQRETGSPSLRVEPVAEARHGYAAALASCAGEPHPLATLERE